jgi:integrase/recombinase XerD
MKTRHYRPSRDPMKRFEEEMLLRGLSKRTIKSYKSYVEACLKFCNKSPRDITAAYVKSYLGHLAKKYSASTVNTAYSAMQFYFTRVLNRNFFSSIPRAKKQKRLPIVLSKKEIELMVSKTLNSKHKCMLQLLYGSGLRLNELLNLKMENIDFGRGIVQVVGGKGGKDRLAPLPQKLVPILKKQRDLKKPQDLLFTGLKGKKLSSNTVGQVVNQAAVRAKITKRATPHTLRHSFATHLLESGVSIRYIQKLLGHSRIMTTEVYTHVAQSRLENMPSPLDS